MTDLEAFELAVNIADAGQGRVPERADAAHPVCADHRDVHERPLLIVPPWINKFYILDLKPKNSFIKCAVDAEPHSVRDLLDQSRRSLAHKSFDDYQREGRCRARRRARRRPACAGERIGYCIGGTLTARTLACMAAQRQLARRQRHVLHRAARLLRRRRTRGVHRRAAAPARSTPHGGGLPRRPPHGDAFNLLRANDLIWSFVINNYLLGRKPLRSTCSTGTRTDADAGGMHNFYLRSMYQRNLLRDPADHPRRVPIDLAVTQPSFSRARDTSRLALDLAARVALRRCASCSRLRHIAA